MQEELNQASKKASKTAKNIANTVSSKVEDAADEVTGGGGARQTLNNVTDVATDYLSSFNSSPLGFIRQYPMQAAIGGVVLGFLLGSAVAKNAVTK